MTATTDKDSKKAEAEEEKVPGMRFEIRNGDDSSEDNVLAALEVKFDANRPWQLMSSVGSSLHQVLENSPIVILNIPAGSAKEAEKKLKKEEVVPEETPEVVSLKAQAETDKKA